MRFQVPLNVTSAGVYYFEAIPPGRRRIIRSVVIAANQNVPSGGLLSVVSQFYGTLFSAGSGQAIPITPGSFQLVQPIEWRSGENIWMTAPSGSTSSTPQLLARLGQVATALSSASFSSTSAVAAGQYVIVAAAAINLTKGASFAVSDTQGNSYTQIAADLGSPGANASALFVSQLTAPLSTSDSLSISLGGAGASTLWFGAGAFTGLAGTMPYGTQTAHAATGAPTVTTSASIASGDLVLGCLAHQDTRAATQPAGWTNLESDTAAFNTSGYEIPSSAGAQAYNPAVVTSTHPWSETVCALRAASSPGAGAYQLGLALVGDEYPT